MAKKQQEQTKAPAETKEAKATKGGKNVDTLTIPDLEKIAHSRDDMGANVQSLRIQILNFAQAYSQFHGIRDGRKVTENEDKRVQARALEAATRAKESIRIYLREIGKNCDDLYTVIGE